jgi:hypothetical protein
MLGFFIIISLLYLFYFFFIFGYLNLNYSMTQWFFMFDNHELYNKSNIIYLNLHIIVTALFYIVYRFR